MSLAAKPEVLIHIPREVHQEPVFVVFLEQYAQKIKKGMELEKVFLMEDEV